MNDLHQAYCVLQLSPGTSLELINQRYKRLVMSWHPDKFRGEEAKSTAERELKKINNARDILRNHFRDGGHTESGNCNCRPKPENTSYAHAKTSETSNATSHGTGRPPDDYHFTGAPFTSRKTNDATKASDDASSGDRFHNSLRREKNEDASLRYLASLICALVLVMLLIVTVVSDVFASTSDFVRNSFKVGQHNFSSLFPNQCESKDPVLPKSQSGVATDSCWYHGHLAVPPSQLSESRAQKLHALADGCQRYSGYIAFSQRKLAEIENTLTKPELSMSERRCALSDRETQTKFLRENQENLKFSHQQLHDFIRAEPLSVP